MGRITGIGDQHYPLGPIAIWQLEQIRAFPHTPVIAASLAETALERPVFKIFGGVYFNGVTGRQYQAPAISISKDFGVPEIGQTRFQNRIIIRFDERLAGIVTERNGLALSSSGRSIKRNDTVAHAYRAARKDHPQ